MLKNWVLSAPNRVDRLIGYDGENLARTLAVHVDDPAQWQYKFELRFADGKVNILDAMLHGNVASCALKESYLSAAGPCELQVRGMSGEREIKSNVLGLMLAESIHAGQNFSAPSEFEQLEQNLTNIKEQAVAAAGQAQNAVDRAEQTAERAETAADCAEASAGRAEEAANKAGIFSQNAPKIQNGNWWVYNPVSGQYEDSRQKAQGDKGETGAQGLPGQKGTPGEQGTKGENGFSPTIQTEPTEDGTTVTITDHTGTKSFTVKHGAKGDKGERGEQGAQGQKGETGARGEQGERGHDFTILGSYESKETLQQAVTSPQAGDTYAVGAAQPYDIYIYDGVTTDWTNYGKLQGAKGDTGAKGEPGIPGEKGAPGQTGATGAKGDPGEKGVDGYSPTVQTTPIEGGTTVTITDHAGEKSFTVKDGAKGEKGEPGQAGAPGAKGDRGDPGLAGAKGDAGEPGKSAYQAALDGGFSGEESAFNTSLREVGSKITAPENAEDGQILVYRDNAWTAETPGSLGGLALSKIEITTPPKKTAYLVGDTFDPEGMVVTATYSNGATLAATGYSVESSGALTIGVSSVTIRYTEGGVSKTTTQAITVGKHKLTTPSQSGGLTYIGVVQSPTWSDYDPEKLQIGGTTSGTNANSYEATFTIIDTDKYEWSDQTNQPKPVSWSIAKAAGSLSISPTSIQLDSQHRSATITVTRVGDGTITATSSPSGIVTTAVSGNTITVENVGELSGNTTITVHVAAGTNHTAPEDESCDVCASFITIYGVQWDGTSTTAFSRTDAAATFIDPVPAVSNGSGSSPFDNLMPWKGMTRTTDPQAGELVAIPKFWYRWTKSGKTMKLQIADGKAEGFFCSPAHADRGDGKGERDVVYVGRYHCVSGLKSTTGQIPKTAISRSSARDNIHRLGETIWQWDFAMHWTIGMLYLVEFASWDSQRKIGYGCSESGKKENNGKTDSMKYHTGTTVSKRDSYGFTQYRNIEGLWDNVEDWMDGCHYNSSQLRVIMNPSQFGDSGSVGTSVGTPSSGYPTAMEIPTQSGFEWALYPSVSGGGDAIYISDSCTFNDPALRCGGSYINKKLSSGLFYIQGYSSTSSLEQTGCRLMKLP